MRSRGQNVAASIKAEGAGVMVVTVKRSSSVIALREIELTEVWDKACESVLYEFQPRLLIATCGPQRYGAIERRFEMHLLRMLLASSRWCQLVDFERITSISAHAAEIRTVCGWLAAADVTVRLADRGELFKPRTLLANAERLLDLEVQAHRERLL